MWQHRQSYEQSNMVDVTIQCQFNIASKNVAEFSTMFASPAPGNQQTDCHNDFSSPTGYRTQCDFEGYQQHFRPTHHTAIPKNIQQSNQQLMPTSKLQQTSLSPTASHHVTKTYPINSQYLDDSGYSSPSTYRQYPLQAAFTTSSSFSSNGPADGDFAKPRDFLPQQQSVFQNMTSDSYIDQWFYSQCNYAGYNAQTPTRAEVIETSSPIRDVDDHCEEMKLAMREKDVTNRLYTLRGTNKDAADEVEQYYQSQTSLIDLERHNILCQMAFDMDSSESINKYYNRKLITLLDSVEQKLSAVETSDKKCKIVNKMCAAGNQKKSRLLPKHAVKILESWYQENLENPYPSRDVTLTMASEGGITVEQIRKWFANKRNRSRNSKLKKGLLEDSE